MLNSGAFLRPGDSGADTSYGTLTFTPASSGGTHNLQGSIVLGISMATVTDPTFGGYAIGTTLYHAWLDGINGIGAHDRVIINNPGSYGVNFLTTTGSLRVVGPNFTPAMGQVFNLFDWATGLSKNFTGFVFNSGYLAGNGDEGDDLDLPDLSGTGLFWDFSRFSESGNIAVVPEPGRALLFGFGCLVFLLRRCRR